MNGDGSEWQEELRAHDDLFEKQQVTIWLGAEPTFTKRDSTQNEWLNLVESSEKEQFAQRFLEKLGPKLHPNSLCFRAIGRQYPEEEEPRFCYAVAYPRHEEQSLLPWKEIWKQCPAESGSNNKALELPILGPTYALLTITPDPGVIEVNTAPAHNLACFSTWSQVVYESAEEVGLSAYRFGYNGLLSDSGGGGQITLGGPKPQNSPFALYPTLLSGMVRYFNHHPSLSYWFASDCVGSAGQGPRPDESVRERFEELELALQWLEHRASPPTLRDQWSTLAPLLVDASGNSHRAEINIEKLDNPSFGARGSMGVVEFRAMRMQATAPRMTAVAALLRLIALRLIKYPFTTLLQDWGQSLHTQHALPWFLHRDLQLVLKDLEDCGVPVGKQMQAMLTQDVPIRAQLHEQGATLEVRDSMEFWPLIGDVASQEKQSSRLVDSSIRRVEVRVTVPAGEDPGYMIAGRRRVNLLLPESGSSKQVWLRGIRYRIFEPIHGFHPGLPPMDPLELTWVRGTSIQTLRLHAWLPGGGVYPGFPASYDEAKARRKQRVEHATVSTLPVIESQAPESPWTTDLRLMR
jgi:uncharacterized protein (DUF2126 family)